MTTMAALIHVSTYLGRTLTEARTLVLFSDGGPPADALLSYCRVRRAFYIRVEGPPKLKSLTPEAIADSVPVGEILALPDIGDFAAFLSLLPESTQPVAAFDDADYDKALQSLRQPGGNLRKLDRRCGAALRRALLATSEDPTVVYAITGHAVAPAKSSWHYFAPETEWLAQRFLEAHRHLAQQLGTTLGDVNMPAQLDTHVGASGVPKSDAVARLMASVWAKVNVRRPSAEEAHNWSTVRLAIGLAFNVASRCEGHLGFPLWDPSTGVIQKQEKDRGSRYQECLAYLCPSVNELALEYSARSRQLAETGAYESLRDGFLLYVYRNGRLQALTSKVVDRVIRVAFPLGIRALRKFVRTHFASRGQHGEVLNALLGQAEAGGHMSHRFSVGSYDVLFDLSRSIETEMIALGWKALT